MTTYAVTGATGGLGGATVDALIRRGIAATDIVAVVRNPDRAEPLRARGVTVRVADYANRAALETAFTGVDRLLLVSGPEVGKRLPQHTNVIDAATTSGVGLIGYTSILHAADSPLALAQEHAQTEKALARSGIPAVVLRNGWYWENFVRSAPAALEHGALYGCAGDGKTAGAARADYAEAAAAALIDGTPAVLELAGAEHLTHAQIATAIGEHAGQEVDYRDIPESEYAALLAGSGVPAPFAAILADSDSGTATGALDSDDPALSDLIGRTPASFADVLRADLHQQVRLDG